LHGLVLLAMKMTDMWVISGKTIRETAHRFKFISLAKPVEKHAKADCGLNLIAPYKVRVVHLHQLAQGVLTKGCLEECLKSKSPEQATRCNHTALSFCWIKTRPPSQLRRYHRTHAFTTRGVKASQSNHLKKDGNPNGSSRKHTRP
jgi:hypothetical protein